MGHRFDAEVVARLGRVQHQVRQQGRGGNRDLVLAAVADRGAPVPAAVVQRQFFLLRNAARAAVVVLQRNIADAGGDMPGIGLP